MERVLSQVIIIYGIGDSSGEDMNNLENKKFLILLIVVFPLMLLAVALYLESTLCTTIALLAWIGGTVMTLYIPFGMRDRE